MNNTNIRHLLFYFLESACFADGGDGDVSVVSPNYINLADEFGKWCELNDNIWWTREDCADCITYFNDQEHIWFSESEISCFATTIIKTDL